MRRLAAAGKTIFMTSHLLADVEDVCDRIAILCEGQMRAEGRVEDLLQRPDAVALTLEGLTPGQLDEIRRELTRRTNRPVACERPRISLETFFLQVVAAAGSAATATPPAAPAAPFLLGGRVGTGDPP